MAAAVLGLLLAAGFLALLYAGADPPQRAHDLRWVTFPLVLAMPAVLALLSLPSRSLLLVPAAVLGLVLAFASFSGVTLVLLVPAVLSLSAYRRRREPAVPLRTALVLAVPLLAGIGAFAVMLVHPDPLCWSWVEDRSGHRSYQVDRDAACMGESGTMSGGSVGELGQATGFGGTSDTVSALEAGASAALVAGGLLGARALAPTGRVEGPA